MKNTIVTILTICALMCMGCEEDKTEAIFNPDETAPFKPVINAVEPSGGALADYSEISISGQNFAASAAANKVYFNNVQAEILSASSGQLVVKAPDLSHDSLLIKVVVEGAFELATYGPYRLEAVSSTYGGFGNLDKIQRITLDKEENLYTFMDNKEFLKITPDGERSVLAEFRYPRVLDLKIGPNDSLYFVAFFLRGLYRLSTSGGEIEEWIEFPNRINTLDFDKNQNIYSAGSKTGIYQVDPTGVVTTRGAHENFTIDVLRVYDDHVYFMGSYSGSNAEFASNGIWRSPITSAEGDLGDIEEVLDFSATGDYAEVNHNAFTFSADGDLYVGTSFDQPVLHQNTSGVIDSLYQGILVPTVVSMEWGNDTFMFLNVSNDDPNLSRVYKVQMLKEGAPYYGRE